ncbi:hypothetical protein GUJ93_ZPchr0010g8399 [Zizania palustris]|uniref:Uncharacterized protein n=1 Tax=Zizania palustris TaxID=103762 RepID=A0A8J5TBW8_ZIZPA|nr:hypothetical protein GUJ93_ZPchr0010g8399 [Zizania palustris]
MTKKVAAAMDAKEAAEEVMRRNAELEKAAAEAAAREERLRRELEAALARLAVAEEAEERLCVQLGELEAEAVAQAVEYQQHVRELSERLAFMDGGLSGAREIVCGVEDSLNTIIDLFTVVFAITDLLSAYGYNCRKSTKPKPLRRLEFWPKRDFPSE